MALIYDYSVAAAMRAAAAGVADRLWARRITLEEPLVRQLADVLAAAATDFLRRNGVPVAEPEAEAGSGSEQQSIQILGARVLVEELRAALQQQVVERAERDRRRRAAREQALAEGGWMSAGGGEWMIIGQGPAAHLQLLEDGTIRAAGDTSLLRYAFELLESAEARLEQEEQDG